MAAAVTCLEKKKKKKRHRTELLPVCAGTFSIAFSGLWAVPCDMTESQYQQSTVTVSKCKLLKSDKALKYRLRHTGYKISSGALARPSFKLAIPSSDLFPWFQIQTKAQTVKAPSPLLFFFFFRVFSKVSWLYKCSYTICTKVNKEGDRCVQGKVERHNGTLVTLHVLYTRLALGKHSLHNVHTGKQIAFSSQRVGQLPLLSFTTPSPQQYLGHEMKGGKNNKRMATL